SPRCIVAFPPPRALPRASNCPRARGLWLSFNSERIPSRGRRPRGGRESRKLRLGTVQPPTTRRWLAGYSTSGMLRYVQLHRLCMAIQSVTRTHRASIRNQRQVRDGLDTLGFAAAKLWNVARWTAGRVWDACGQIPDD